MKLKDLSDLIIFDAFPLTYDPKQKIILTHLLHLEEQILPQKLCTIYTTRNLAEKFKKYCEITNYKGLFTDNFCYLEPYNFIDIIIEKQHTLQMFTCESQDADHNLMILIRENGKLNYIYAGNFLDTRTALLNDDFAKWISQGVEKLYVNLKHVPDDQLYKSVQKLPLLAQCLKDIDTIVEYHEGRTFAIYLNLFGYENFIHKLSNRFPKRVALLSNLSIFSDYSEKRDDKLLEKLDVGRIFVTDGVISEEKAKENFEKHGNISINVRADSASCLPIGLNKGNHFYRLCYSPEPNTFDLQLLVCLCKPKRLYGIIDRFNMKSKPPKHLIEYCKGIPKVSKKPQQQQQPDAKLENKPALPVILGPISYNQNQQGAHRGPFLDDCESDEDNS
uniref:Uncharacterized protein n=1 Tax=Glossina palpalis gambiensis TaxID=67801 RepID=A0A1B0BHL8_9MUSC